MSDALIQEARVRLAAARAAQSDKRAAMLAARLEWQDADREHLRAMDATAEASVALDALLAQQACTDSRT